jgi:cell division protein FtsQ
VAIAPSGRSILIGLALLLAGVGAYLGARSTSVFAVRTLDVRGGTPALRAEVRAALATDLGASLLRVDGGTVSSALEPIPGVRSFTYDRAFPHTLRVVVRPEQAVLVLRQGSSAYLVAASGKVVRSLPHPRLSGLPRLWVGRDVAVQVGETLPPATAAAAAALGPLRSAPLPGGVRVVRGGKELTLVLGGGLEVRLGDVGDLRLKLAIARRILRAGAAATGAGYVDVSVPERPVLAADPRVGG